LTWNGEVLLAGITNEPTEKCPLTGSCAQLRECERETSGSVQFWSSASLIAIMTIKRLPGRQL
jgi:hypothetical protein